MLDNTNKTLSQGPASSTHASEPEQVSPTPVSPTPVSPTHVSAPSATAPVVPVSKAQVAPPDRLTTLRVLCFGDLIGIAGCTAFQKHAMRLKREYDAQLIIVNGENAAPNGRGITSKTVASLRHCGANIITGGNHSFDQRDSYPLLEEKGTLLRPANFPNACPGTGVGLFTLGSLKIGVINVQGRVYMRQDIDCPFKLADSALTYLQSQTNIIIVDMHAEASSEKIGLGYHLDGRVSLVFGTHTHVQTADERILPKGTGFITDIGMAGSLNGMIGMKKETVMAQLLTQMPVKFETDTEPPFIITGIVADIDTVTGKAIKVERFVVIDE